MRFEAHHVLLAALLAAAVVFDVRARRIPNALSLAALSSGLLLAARGGFADVIASLQAVAVLLGCGVVAWRHRLVGGGDVKLAVGCAAWMSLGMVPEFAAATALAGGAASVVCYALSNNAARQAMRANLVGSVLVRTMPAPNAGPIDGRVSVPYSIPIAVGALCAVTGG